MKKFLYKHLKFCPKTGRFIGFNQNSKLSRFLFPFIGLAAMVWILIRVIPKPSRLSYPCVRAAMPIASGFIGYLVILFVSAVAFARSKKPLQYFPVFFVGAFAIFGIAGFYLVGDDILHKDIQITVDAVVTPDQPMGVAQGIFPGRVVWIHNPNAVNQNCNPSLLNHAWWMAENNHQSTVDSMVSAAIDSLTGQKSDSAAWVALFKYNNAARGKGAVGYVSGEKIFIKINECSGWGGNYNTTDLSKVNGSWYGMSETTPAMVISVLHQLVDIAHVAQSDIYVGDPMRNIYKEWYAQWLPKYPDVHYIGPDNYANLGREQVKASKTSLIYYSDRGTVLHPNVMYSMSNIDTTKVYHDTLYSVYDSVEYLIDLPQLKGHKRAGMTMFAKNHFGSQTRSSAAHLHLGLPCPIEMQNDTSRLGYGLYRVQVDFMTSSILRKKNLIFLMDALWGTDYEQDKPLKWQMEPFNNNYSSSVFASLDNVAIESVGYDFLRSEFTVTRGAGTFVQMRGADDYLHQAADSTNWPDGIKYDPDSTGVHIYSLGVHEHWNNPTDKKYSRNLGTGDGIELLDVELPASGATGIASNASNNPKYFELNQNYPNPFNPTTTISYTLPERSSVEVSIIDVQGRIVRSFVFGAQSAGSHSMVWNGANSQGIAMSSGLYVCRVRVAPTGSGKAFEKSAKMLLLK
jgi:hypothetical protein